MLDLIPAWSNPIIGMANPDHYRNKMEITFGEDGKIGMHEVGKFLNASTGKTHPSLRKLWLR